MNWFWHALIVCLIIIPITIMWLAIVIELFRRHDLSGWVRVAWLLAVFAFPLIGSFAYLIVTWLRADAAHDLGAAPAAPGVPENPSTISDLSRLDRLRRAGVVSDDDFESGKRRILEGTAAPHGRQLSPGEGIGS